MERVLGVGGVFIRSKDREALAKWYAKHLGLEIDESWWGASLPARHPDERDTAQTVWSAFPEDTEYFGTGQQQVMVNFRVRDLERMLTQLRELGCNVVDATEPSDFGQFGWVTDPDGNRIELWQPPGS